MLLRGKLDRGVLELVDTERLVPQNHLLRKIDAAVNWEHLYGMVEPLYCENNGRPNIDPVVLVKMVLIQHLCTHSKDCVKTVQRHIWKDYEELADDARYTPEYRDLYARRKETFERVFADAKEKHAMHYTQYRGLAQVTSWVKPKFVAMKLRKFTNESGGLLCPSPYP